MLNHNFLIKGMIMNKVTIQDTIQWLGSDIRMSEIYEIITELANNEYDQHQLKKDIIDYKQV